MTPELEALRAATPQGEIKQRQGPGGRQLDYIDARFVMDRLDEAVGPENWRDVYEEAGNGSVRCGLSVRVGNEWITKWDVGDQSDIEPTKGAHSDAFKRAAVKWGIGRDLYGDHAAPQRPQVVRNTPQQAGARPGASTVPQRDDSMGLTARQFFDAAEPAFDRRLISDVARELFGQWKVTDLTNEQRTHLLEELRFRANGKSKEPEPEWAGVA